MIKKDDKVNKTIKDNDDLTYDFVHNFNKYSVSNCMFLSCHVCVSERIHTPWLPECQGTPWSKQAQNLKVK